MPYGPLAQNFVMCHGPPGGVCLCDKCLCEEFVSVLWAIAGIFYVLWATAGNLLFCPMGHDTELFSTVQKHMKMIEKLTLFF